MGLPRGLAGASNDYHPREPTLPDLIDVLLARPDRQCPIANPLAVDAYTALLYQPECFRRALDESCRLEQVCDADCFTFRHDFDEREICGCGLVAVSRDEVRVRALRGGGVVESSHDLLSEEKLHVAWIFAGHHAFPETLELGERTRAQQVEVPPHELVGNTHELAEHLRRRLGNAYVVAERLRHLVHAVEPFEQRHRHHDLLWLSV